MKFQKARFHVDSGPESLFNRVRFKMTGINEVKMHGSHFSARCIERNIPDPVMEKIKHFSCNEWVLKTCEVRMDTGKFVNSTWELTVDGAAYWLTIGFGNVAETIIRKDSSGKTGITESGEFYEFVEKVNVSLMAQELDGLKQ